MAMDVFKRSRGWSSKFLLLLTLSVILGGRRLDALEYESEITMPMPSVAAPKHNDYKCTGMPLPNVYQEYIVGYEPRADPRVAHHMLMFGCSHSVPQSTWSCKSTSSVCRSSGDFGKILYAWALNASGLQLPTDVGMEIGSHVHIKSLVLQIHYGHPETVPDLSATSKDALVLHISSQKPKYVAGIFLLGTFSPLPPGREQVFSDSACKFHGPNAIHPFAFRTHAHSLGKQIVGYIVKPGREWQLIGTRSPQDAQTFYPAFSDTLEVDVGDTLAVRCVFTTKDVNHEVNMGPDSEDEMCNFYIMYYMDNNGRSLFNDDCWDRPSPSLIYPDSLPPLPQLVVNPMEHHHHGMGGDEEEEEDDHGEADGDSEEQEDVDYKCPVPIPPGDPSRCPTPTTTPPGFIEGEANSSPAALGLVEAEDWALNDVSIPDTTLGQVSAVAVDHHGNVHILHRGPVTWDFSSFNNDFTYRYIDNGPIREPTLLQFSPKGEPLNAWGENLFYLPHGLTIDSKGAFWVTDTAMHQVFKFSNRGDSSPSLVLGMAFKPGDGFGHFCQPSSVAVQENGMFFVADGYCNRRILKFDAVGSLLETWDQPVGFVSLFIPHKLSLSNDETKLFVADRENRRVLTYNTRTGASHIFSDDLDSPVYAVCVNGSHDWPMYGVFGGERSPMGFTMDSRGEVVTTWGPSAGFSRPHDLTVDSVRGAVYISEIGPNRIWKFVTLFAHSDDDVPVVGVTTTALPKAHTSHHTPATQPPPASQPSQPPPASQPSQAPPASQPLSEHIITYKVMTTLSPVESANTDYHDNSSTEAVGNDTANAESADNEDPKDAAMKRATFNIGIFVAIFVVVVVVLLVVFGILREHRYLRKLSLYLGSKRQQNGVADGGGVKVETRGRKGKPLHSLLGPSRPGFSRLKTYDSDSEEEEFPVFNRV